jgi:hypothetical protein
VPAPPPAAALHPCAAPPSPGKGEKVDPTVYVTIEGEQVPDPEGLCRIELDWRLGEIDRRTSGGLEVEPI